MKPRLLTVAFLVGIVLLLELLCAIGQIGRITMQPPHQIAIDLWRILASGSMNAAIRQTLGNAAIAVALALVFGVIAAVIIHGMPQVREALDPVFSTYYAIPILAFYPLLIVLMGLGDGPQIAIGFMMGFIAVIVNTLNGLDRVPRVMRKLAAVQQMNRVQTACRITLPYAWPFVLTGAKLAVSYSLIGVIASEFIMSRGGMGFEISFAYNNFDNARMYPLILMVLMSAVCVNAVLFWWERRILLQRGMRR